MTNGDKIRQMGDEELAELMNDEPCPPLYRRKRCPEERNCFECWSEWLKMEVSEQSSSASVAAERRSKVSARCASASVALTGSASVGGFAASKVSRLTPLGKGRAWLGEEADGADCSDRADESEKQGDEIEAASDEIAALTKELNKIEEEKNQNGNA